MKHEAWRNMDLWSTTLDELVARDKQRWMNLQQHMRELLGFAVTGEQIIRLTIVFRVKSLGKQHFVLPQAYTTHDGGSYSYRETCVWFFPLCIVRSMLDLRTPFPLIESVISRCNEAHGVAFTLDEVTQPTPIQSSLWLLDLAGKASLVPPAAALSGLLTPDSDELLLAEVSKQGKASTNATQVVRWASEAVIRATHSTCLGYSVYHELFRLSVERLGMESKRSLPTPPPPPMNNNNNNSNTSGHTTTSSSSMVSPRTRLCLCGKPYDSWRLLGGYNPTGEFLNRASAFLCESCFRTVVAQRILNFETANVKEGEDWVCLQSDLWMRAC